MLSNFSPSSASFWPLQVDVTTLYYPRSLAQVFGNGKTFAMGGTFLT